MTLFSKAVDNFVCLGVLRKRFASVRKYAAAFTLCNTLCHGAYSMLALTSLALKYLWVVQHTQAPTCLRPWFYTQSLYLDSDQSLCALRNIPGDSDVCPRHLLDTVDFGTTATDDPSYQCIRHCHLHCPVGQRLFVNE